MISFIKGTVAYVDAEQIIVDNHGVGYQILTSSTTMQQVKIGQEVMIHTHFHVTDKSMALIGFVTKEEVTLFQTLLSLTGVGPKNALAILSTLSIRDLYYAVFSEDVKAIAKTPGIGPKGAKRLIIDLKDKLKMEDLADEVDSVEAVNEAPLLNSDSVSDTIEALAALGYSNGEAYRAVRAVKGAVDMDSETLLKEALKAMLTLK